MKVCIPTKNNNGFEATLSVHFGSAPYFTVYDTETREIKAVKNQNQHHDHGQCSPRKAVEALGVRAVIASGLGGRALQGLNQSGIKVYKTQATVVSEITGQIDQHLQDEMTLESTCVHGHSHE